MAAEFPGETIQATQATLGTLNIQKYFFQLTRGCGNAACKNPYCASNKSSPDYAANGRAAAIALDLAKRTDASSHFFCPAIFSLTTTVWRPRNLNPSTTDTNRSTSATSSNSSSGSSYSYDYSSSYSGSDTRTTSGTRTTAKSTTKKRRKTKSKSKTKGKEKKKKGGEVGPDDDVDGAEDGNIVVDKTEITFGNAIGRGSFGVVYRGEWLGTAVALKMLYDSSDPYHIAMAKRETRVLQLVRHPNIVQFIGVCRADEGLYLITEFLPLGDVRGILQNQNIGLSWKVRVRWCMDISRAMSYLHRLGIIHRDLKTKNLLIDSQYRAKVCDFGLARKHTKKKKVMTLCGTYDFMAPEVTMGEAYGSAADVFSYGVVMAEVVTRLKSIPRKSNLTVDFKKLQMPSNCPASLDKLCQECCSLAPEKRPTFAEVLTRLAEDVKPALVREESDIWEVGSGSSSGSDSDSLREKLASGSVVRTDIESAALEQALSDAELAQKLQAEEDALLSERMEQLVSDQEMARSLQESFQAEAGNKKAAVASHRGGAPAAVATEVPKAGKDKGKGKGKGKGKSKSKSKSKSVVKGKGKDKASRKGGESMIAQGANLAGNLFAQIRGSVSGLPVLRNAQQARPVDSERVLIPATPNTEEQLLNLLNKAMTGRRGKMREDEDSGATSEGEWTSTVVRLPKKS